MKQPKQDEAKTSPRTDVNSMTDHGDQKTSDLEGEAAKQAPIAAKDGGLLKSSGKYALTSLVTHKGRGANAGHYIGWRKEGSQWYKFDDDVVTEVKSEDVEKLCGGGDNDTAYILMYTRIDDLV